MNVECFHNMYITLGIATNFQLEYLGTKNYIYDEKTFALNILYFLCVVSTLPQAYISTSQIISKVYGECAVLQTSTQSQKIAV